MDTITFWQIMGFSSIIFMMFMYSILDGFDLGIGILIGFVTANDEEKKKLLAAVTPYWDGNEVWLVIAVSTLFAAFPAAYSTMLPSFYLPFLAIIILFICRAISLDFTYGGSRIAKIPLAVFSITSFLAAFFGIFFLTVIVSGITIDGTGAFRVTAGNLLRPGPMVFTAAWLLLLLLHSISYLAGKSDGMLKERLLRYAKRLWAVNMALFPAALVLLCHDLPEIWGKPVIWLGIAITISAMGLHRIAQKPSLEKFMFPLSTLAMGGVWLIIAGALFPNIVNAARQDNALMTIYNSSAPLNTLKLVVLSAMAGMAAIIAFALFTYGILGRKRKKQEVLL